jgi:L-alanine-DL-glutamate epimerase-like enolase superfamily enzyme
MTSALRDIKVAGVAGFTHTTHRSKLIGCNAKKGVHGQDSTEPVLRIYADNGLDGIGFGGRVTADDAQAIVGRSLAELWDAKVGATTLLRRADHALYDLVGKVLGEPVWRLLGGEGPEWVPVYDTTLYFSDLLPEYAQRGANRLVEEFEEGLARGHTEFKLKVGRGARWMDAKSGFARDVEVVRRLARAAPAGVKLMADANDQFGVDNARRFLGEVGEHLRFLEEPFPESIEDGRALRQWIVDNGMHTLLADGETQHDPQLLLEVARGGGVDVVQPDIRALGISLQRKVAHDVAALPNVQFAPHCWGSYLGTFMMLMVARGVRNVMTCEIDAMTSDLFDDSAFVLQNGRMRVPDAPGCGLSLHEDVFRRKYLPHAWRVGTVGA